MIAEQANLSLHSLIDAFTRIRAVSDDIAKAVNVLNFLRTNICQDRLEPFEVAVNITNDGDQGTTAPRVGLPADMPERFSRPCSVTDARTKASSATTAAAGNLDRV